MAPPASIIVPTRKRAGYLDVALASIAPQAAAAGAELLVVDDGPDAATAATARRHGARYVAHERSRGLNAARNTGIDAARGELLVFVDDDVARAARLARGAAATPTRTPSRDVGVLDGPDPCALRGSPACARAGARARRSRARSSATTIATCRMPGGRT